MEYNLRQSNTIQIDALSIFLLNKEMSCQMCQKGDIRVKMDVYGNPTC